MLKKANDLLYSSYYQEAIQEYDQIISTKPDKDIILAAFYNQAQAYDGIGQYSSSAANYQKIIDIDPQFRKGQIYYQQGQVYQLARMHSQSRKAYETFIQLYPKHPQCYFNLGQLLQTIGDQQQAIKCYEKASEYKPNYSKAHLNKISILKKLKRHDQILKTCSKALQSEPTDFQILYQQGFSLISLQRFKEAISSLKQCIRNNKKYVKAYIALGDCYYKIEKESEGLQILNNCLEYNKDVMKSIEKKEIKILIGTIYMSAKQYKIAIDCFREVLSQRPISQSVKLKLAYCLEEYGNGFFANRQFSDALTCYNESLKYDNTRNSILNNQGLAYQNINNYQDAEKCFNEVLKRQPKNVTALNNIASLYKLMGKNDKSKEILQKLAIENPNNLEVHISNGRNYLSLHKYQQAYYEFEKAIKLNRDCSNYGLFNNMAVTLQKLNRNEQALTYADQANDLTKNRSPLLLLNRASILMNLQKSNLAKKDFERAAEELRTPDKKNLSQLGLNLDNLKYMFNQLNHYAYLMTPINDFRKEIISQINKLPVKDEQKFSKVVETVTKAEEYVMTRIIEAIKKENTQEAPNPEESRQDYNTIIKYMEEAKKQINNLRAEVKLLKMESGEIKEKLKYLPQSIALKHKLQSLYDEGDIPIWQYGKQLYWILNGYLKGYLLISTGVVAKGQEINRSTFNKALKSISGVAEFAQNIPIISDFSDLISRICGLFVDMEDEAIIEKMYQVISYNYDTEEDLNDQICDSVLAILNSPQKIAKIKGKLVFKPSQGLLQSVAQNLEDVFSWFSQKKNEFIMHMRGFQKAENIIQSQLAVIDVGAIISVLLGMESNSTKKLRVIKNAALKISIGNHVQRMVLEAYKRENENIRVSNNSFCTVMKCLIVYDNPLLNDPNFLDYFRTKSRQSSLKQVLNLPHIHFKRTASLLENMRYGEILALLAFIQ